jgi:P4 family phage/plasmid primase-like protien
MYSKGDFCNYLLSFKVDKGCEFTHTSIIKPTGAFYIPSDEEDKFFEKYDIAKRCNEELYLTEKHKSIGPIVIDLDFRFDKNDKVERMYTKDTVISILNIYKDVICMFYDVPEFDFYVMEKPSPVLDKQYIKDGIHIVIPNIITTPGVQLMIRNMILPSIGNALDSLNLKNNYSDVIDEAVIYKNNWQMYGSKKPNCEAYKVTYIFKYQDGELKNCPVDVNDEYVQILSIRNKYVETDLKIEIRPKVIEFENKRKLEAKKMTDKRLTKINTKKNTCDNLEFVAKLINILSVSRADKYDDWIRTGWCLRNIDYRLLDKWIEFSQKSSKFIDGECEKVWNMMKDDGLGIGTLHMWAKQDNKEMYDKIIESDLFCLISSSSSKTHHDIAKVVHFLYKYEFVCISIKHNYWYEFKNHRWIPSDCAHSLRSKLSTDVVKKYCAASAYFANKASSEDDADQRDRYTEKSKKLLEIANKLKDCPFKENILKECRDLFYMEKFEEKLDSRCNLIGFENGVYDLEVYEFREGRPEDYIAFTTGNNFVEYDETHPYMLDVHGFLNKVFTKHDIKDYVMKVLASFMNGNIREERFHIWTGTGANGKSKIIELFESAFGDYCCKFPITLLTQKRAASNAATSELARAKGKRFACLQEPSEDEKLNIGLMKELTGGDKIMARALFKEPIEFKPQFKMILTCNHLPNVPSDDGGTWRRIRVVEFTSKFTDNPDPENPDEFLADRELSYKFSDWKEHFMSLLIEYYKSYIKDGIFEPEDVLKCTKEYQKNNDTCLEFLEQEVEKNDRGFVSINDVFSKFTYWIKENAPHYKITTKKAFASSIEKTLGKSIHAGKIQGWKGFSFKQDGYLDADDPLGI